MKNPKIGAHVSVAGGLEKGVKIAEKIGAECIQIFAGSPRRYEVSLLESSKLEKYERSIEKTKIFPVFIHASYLLNLASEDKSIYQKSKKSLTNSLRFVDQINGQGVIYHPGSPKGKDKGLAIEREIESIQEILETTPEKSVLIIENTAGEKKIGTDPKEVGYMHRRINSPRLKVCVDTAHSLESGNIEKFDPENIKKWIDWWDQEVGLENIFVFHINDSLTKAGSKKDRHANIGEGFIGKEGFSNLMKFEKIKDIPWILEVPGFDGGGPDKKNIDILKKIRE